MVRALAIGATLWPLLLASAVWERAAGGHDAWTPWVYAGCGEICHQRPERSFSTRGVRWPVCGRCSGLYLAAPIGAWLAVGARRRHGRGPWFWLGVAAVPTVVTLALEWSGWHAGSSTERALAALPFGAAAAYWIVHAAAGGESAPIRYTDAS